MTKKAFILLDSCLSVFTHTNYWWNGGKN